MIVPKGYDAVSCADCGTHICYMVYCGPHGSLVCDSCMEIRVAEEEEAARQKEEEENGEG